jgi:hypothetical protein
MTENIHIMVHEIECIMIVILVIILSYHAFVTHDEEDNDY